MTSMKRALVFLLLGPASVVFIVWLIYVATGGTPWDFVVAYFALLLFLFTFLVSAIAGLVDGYLARAFPILVRAPMAAIIGSVLAAGLVPVLVRMMLQPQELLLFAIGGALSMGTCSLLANNYRS